MDEAAFRAAMTKARTFCAVGERPDYWRGYERGLRRAYHGEAFGTAEEHALWFSLADEGGDNPRRERGLGYRDGLAFAGS